MEKTISSKQALRLWLLGAVIVALAGCSPCCKHTCGGHCCEHEKPTATAAVEPRTIFSFLGAPGSGKGTLSELCASYMHYKPIVAIKNMGGTTDAFIDKYLDHRKNVKIVGVDTPKEAVKYILKQISK